MKNKYFTNLINLTNLTKNICSKLLNLLPLFLFLGLLLSLWMGLFLNPIYDISDIPINNPANNPVNNTSVNNTIDNSFKNSIEHNTQLSQSFRDILKNFRCLTCQNQNIAESTAPIAIQIRDTIYRQLKEGKSQAAIQDFLVEHYGDFVLYKPPFKKETWLLWLGPSLFFLVALLLVINIFRKKNGRNTRLGDLI